MIDEVILEGLKQALSRGEPLKRAMVSFYNAGYKKEEIEEAANSLQMPSVEQSLQTEQQTKEQFQEKSDGEINNIASMGEIRTKSPAQMRSYQPVQTQRTSIQRVSNYENGSSTEKIVIIVLIFFLIVLVGMLATIFFFKQELVDFFNKMFS